MKIFAVALHGSNKTVVNFVKASCANAAIQVVAAHNYIMPDSFDAKEAKGYQGQFIDGTKHIYDKEWIPSGAIH